LTSRMKRGRLDPHNRAGITGEDVQMNLKKAAGGTTAWKGFRNTPLNHGQ
jgi:hypothetical protein